LAQETDHTEARLMLNARHSDLIVLGRQRHIDLMPYNLIETLLLGSGRPIMIAPASPPLSVTGTIVVGWKETPEAARALGAAMPLLKLAQRVVRVNISEEPDASPPELKHLADRLAWHGIAAESRQVAHGLSDQLLEAFLIIHGSVEATGDLEQPLQFSRTFC
jgi:hypothetical protein